MTIFTYNVATSGYYDILVSGAAGAAGASGAAGDVVYHSSGGQGAYEEARFYFDSGTTLYINVGSAGTETINTIYGGGGGTGTGGSGGGGGGGGGGATSVWIYDNGSYTHPLLVAGGGGGGGGAHYAKNGYDATSISYKGQDSGAVDGTYSERTDYFRGGLAGTNGSGGNNGYFFSGGGGGGWKTNGLTNDYQSHVGYVGFRITSPDAPPVFTATVGLGGTYGVGGVGGGGGGGYYGGGAGGGYSGGGGGGFYDGRAGAGGGGSSYINNSAYQVITSGKSTAAYGFASITFNSFTTTFTCYLPGTRILTTRGEVAVEDLKIGDLLPTVSGENVPIKWLGIQQFIGSFATRDTSPVRFHVGSLGKGLPKRDLYVSAGHSMKIGDQLVDARLLVNGVTITQHQRFEQLEYYHIDLGEHHCILAEGVWSESYLECNANRESFVNAGEFYDTHRYHLTNSLVEKCLPHVADYQDPRHLALFKTLLAHIPADRVTSDPDLHLLADGKRLEPYEFVPQAFMFRVPAGTQLLRLMSRTSRPCELGLPADDRQLGFCIQSLSAQSDDGAIKVSLAPHHAALTQGFHRAEGTQHRWTQGEALLPNMLLGGSTEDMTLTVKGRALPRYHLSYDDEEMSQRHALHKLE